MTAEAAGIIARIAFRVCAFISFVIIGVIIMKAERGRGVSDVTEESRGGGSRAINAGGKYRCWRRGGGARGEAQGAA